jgi:hypothetical protein
MRRLSSAAALVPALFLAWPASALEIAERAFQVSYTHEGTEYVFEDSRVPMLPQNACYSWYLRSVESGAQVRAVERMTLPVAIDWGTVGETPEDITQIEEGGKVAVTTLDMTTDADGWLTHGWCVASGDPPGPHTIEVSVDGASVASFSFEVVAPETYAFPAGKVPAARTDRTVSDSW